MNLLKNITIGSDPEFIVYNPKTSFCYPGMEFTEGTKDDPASIGNGFFIQKDNTLLEGNIPVCRTREEFLYNMNYLIGYFNFLVESMGLTIIHEDSGEYHKSDLKSPEVNIFGCDPYQNVWTNSIQKAPSLSKQTYRTCGFHIHIGYELTSNRISKQEMNSYLVKAFDIFVVLPSYLIHLDKKRTSAYGGLGQYREKPYGVECRSLGSYFTHPNRLEWVWDRLQQAIDFCNERVNLEFLDNLEVLTILENSNIEEYLEAFQYKLINA